MTRRRGCPPLYAPVGPFTEAIEMWLRHQTLLAHGPLGKQTVTPHSMASIAGIGVLAQMAGTSTRTLNDYRNGVIRLIELRRADRLADALDIPLPCLADDFRPMHEWLTELDGANRKAAA